MDDRKRAAGFFQSGNLVYQTSSFTRQPARVLIVDDLHPWWSATCTPLCDALDNFLSLASSLDGASRIPLLSVYAASRQQKCLLPFVPVRGNFVRLHFCVEELRTYCSLTLPGESCIRGAARRGELLRQAVLDSLQQFKRYLSAGNHANVSLSVEVTVVTSDSGRGVLRQLKLGLKGADLVPLRRLLVVQMYNSAEWAQGTPFPEGSLTEADDLYIWGVEVDLQQVNNSAIAMETVLKEWLQEQGEEREQLHLILPSPGDSPVCVKCDMQEPLISPTLILPTRDLGIKTETTRDFLPANKGPANQNALPQRLKAIKVLHADGLCESVMYGLPLVILPTTGWRLDWDEMENNHNLFNALCHTLRSRDLFLLLQSESSQRPRFGGPGDVYSHYVLQPSQSLSLLLKPVVSRELLLPCSVPVSTQEDLTPDAICAIQACLSQLEEEFVFNPLFLNSNLYQHLRSRGYLSQRQYPYELQSTAQKKQTLPLEGPKGTGNKQPRQTHRWPVGANGKVTVAPLPSSSSLSHLSSSFVGPRPAKAWRPALTLLSSGRSSNYRAPARNISTDTSFGGLGREDENDGHAVTGP